MISAENQVAAPPPVVTVGLIALLFVPFAIHMLSVEPFPAIILPAGEHQVDLSEPNFTAQQLVIQAKREADGDFEDIPPEKFLFPAPKHYLHSIARNQFGVEYQWERHIRGRKGIIQFDHSPIGSRLEAHTDATKKWYSQRLAELGFEDSRFYLTTFECEFADDSRNPHRNLVERQTYELR